MKKIIFILTALIITLGANAQNLKFGAKAGMNVAGMSAASYDGEKEKGSDMMIGFHVGGYVNYSINDRFGFQGELLFSAQGANKTEEASGKPEVRMGFINIPLLAEFRLIPNVPEFSVFAGNQIGFNISRKVTWSDGTSASGSKLDDMLKPEKINTLDIAAVIGMQYTFMEHLTVGARYNYGITNGSSGSDDYKVKGNKHNVIQVSVGWTF
ncbi:MAG: PorT family protein [Prevotellaceae bacterium]|jgi:opacity protein-like surface antigen|nr:PorT family protein [Prevotellaceae bacterium]